MFMAELVAGMIWSALPILLLAQLVNWRWNRRVFYRFAQWAAASAAFLCFCVAVIQNPGGDSRGWAGAIAVACGAWVYFGVRKEDTP